MTPADNLEQRLSNQAASVGPGPHTLTETLPGGEVQLTADRLDPTGATLREMAVTRTGPATGESLAERANRVAATRGLSENLRVLEIDSERDQAVIRSDAPESRPDGLRYYEVVVGGEQSTLHRYHAKPNTPREPVPFPMTHETVARLAEALSS